MAACVNLLSTALSIQRPPKVHSETIALLCFQTHIHNFEGIARAHKAGTSMFDLAEDPKSGGINFASERLAVQ
jgi:hypothetical protein